MQNHNIKTDGKYSLSYKHKEPVSIVYVSGDLGGATCKLQMGVGNGAYTDLEEGEILATDSQYVINHGLHMVPVFDVVGSTGSTNITVTVAGSY